MILVDFSRGAVLSALARAVVIFFGPLALLILIHLASPAVASEEIPCISKRVQEELAEIAKLPWLGVDLVASDKGRGPRQLGVAYLTLGGPLRAAGVQVGDWLVGAGGADLSAVTVPPYGAFASEIVPNLKQGVEVRLRLLRDGSEYEIRVTPVRPEGLELPDALGLRMLRPEGLFPDRGIATVPRETEAVPEKREEDCLLDMTRGMLAKISQHGWMGLTRSGMTGTEESSEYHAHIVHPNGPLAAAGVQSGDTILAIDGVDFTKMSMRRGKAAALQLIKGIRPGKDMHLRLRRADTEFEVVVTPAVLEGYNLAKSIGSRLLIAANVSLVRPYPPSAGHRPVSPRQR